MLFCSSDDFLFSTIVKKKAKEHPRILTASSSQQPSKKTKKKSKDECNRGIGEKKGPKVGQGMRRKDRQGWIR